MHGERAGAALEARRKAEEQLERLEGDVTPDLDRRFHSLALEGSPDDLPCFRKRMAFTFARTFGRRQRLVTPRRLGVGRPMPVGTLDP